MSRCRRHRFVRAFVMLLLVWLAADTLSHGTCAHDPLLYGRVGHSQVDGSTSGHHSNDDGDVNHCACHWQFLLESAPQPLTMSVADPVVCSVPAWVPQMIGRALERPPRG